MDTAEHILDAALTEFYRNGFHASGVDQLSKEAGVTKRTLYRHFSSKESLIDSVLQLRHDQFMERMQAFVETAPRQGRPMAYLAFLEAWGKEPDFHGCMFINAAAEYSDAEIAPHRAAKAHKEQVLVYLERICLQAGYRDPQSLAAQLFVMGEGLIVVMQVMGDSQSIMMATRMVFSQLCKDNDLADLSQGQVASIR